MAKRSSRTTEAHFTRVTCTTRIRCWALGTSYTWVPILSSLALRSRISRQTQNTCTNTSSFSLCVFEVCLISFSFDLLMFQKLPADLVKLKL